jgi:hypothetical protein
MTPDTCPHCGAESLESVEGHWLQWSCFTVQYTNMTPHLTAQSPDCKRWEQMRINHLRRMAERAHWLHGWYINGDPCTPTNSWQKWRRYKSDRLYRFHKACMREVERLRGLQ